MALPCRRKSAASFPVLVFASFQRHELNTLYDMTPSFPIAFQQHSTASHIHKLIQRLKTSAITYAELVAVAVTL
jgi:hypothetical protein